MGKASKKTATKVEVATPAAPAPGKNLKKGKREAEEVIDEEVSLKKQKKDVNVEKEKSEVKAVKKKVVKKQESSEESSSSESEEEQPKIAPTKPLKKPALSAANAGKKSVSSDESDGSDSSDESEDEVVPAKSISLPKKPLQGAKVGENSSSSDDSDSSDSSEESEDEAPKSKSTSKNGSMAANKKIEESSDDSESDDTDSDSSEGATPPKRAAPAAISKKGAVSVPKRKGDSESGEGESSSEEDIPETKGSIAAKSSSVAKKDENTSEEDESSSEEDGSSSEENVPETKKGPTTAKNGSISKRDESSNDSESEDEDSSDDDPPAAKKVKVHAEESSEDSSSEESDEEPQQKKIKHQETRPALKRLSAEESEDESESSEEDEEDSNKTPKKNVKDVEMVEALQSKANAEKTAFLSAKKTMTPTTPQSQTSGSKTLFVGNLSYSVEQADVENFFKDVGDVVDVRFAAHPDGALKGYGHVEFATVEAAQKALHVMNGKDLMGRPVRLDNATERGSYTPHSGKDVNSYKKGFGSQGRTIYVRGFDRGADENEVKGELRDLFASCGEITRISVPSGDDGLKGFAYIDFSNNDSVNKAVEFENPKVNEYPLTVEEARPPSDRREGGRGRGRSGGRDGGRSGGRDGGRRGGRFGGRFGGGGRGRGTPNRPNAATVGTGKKTMFNDE